jgi:hypothetical protein
VLKAARPKKAALPFFEAAQKGERAGGAAISR